MFKALIVLYFYPAHVLHWWQGLSPRYSVLPMMLSLLNGTTIDRRTDILLDVPPLCPGKFCFTGEASGFDGETYTSR
jgi:hypothetical protein